MRMWIVILGILIVVLFLILVKPGQTKAPQIWRRGRIEFYSKGVDTGLALSEISLLWNAALRADLPNPPSIYGSVEELDKAINQITGDKKLSDRRDSDPETIMLRKLFEYRRKVEMSRPKYRSSLKSTRNIAVGQRLTIRTGGTGVYSSKVVENKQGYFTITIPAGDPPPLESSWRQDKLNVYFWRKEDAGYFFQTRIIGIFYEGGNRNFRVHHSDNILRSQKRRSIRAPARIPARLFPLKNLDEANQILESAPGLICLVVDLSEEGAALRMGGRGRKNQAFKLQFKIRDEMLVVSGAVRRVNYKSKEDQSILHVEFLPPPESVRMVLLSYVFDIDRSRARGVDAENEDTLSVVFGGAGEKAVTVEDQYSGEILSREGEESTELETPQEGVEEM